MPTAGDFTLAQDFPPAQETANDTNETITETVFTLQTSGVSVTFTANTAGKAFIGLYARMAATAGDQILLGYEVRENDGAGAVIVAASDDRALIENQSGAGGPNRSGRFMATGLTPGGTYFAQTLAKVSGGAGGSVFTRRISAEGAP